MCRKIDGSGREMCTHDEIKIKKIIVFSMSTVAVRPDEDLKADATRLQVVTCYGIENRHNNINALTNCVVERFIISIVVIIMIIVIIIIVCNIGTCKGVGGMIASR